MLTVVRAKVDLCKRLGADGRLIGYQKAKQFWAEEKEVTSLEGLSELLTSLEDRPRNAVLRDKPISANEWGPRNKQRFERVARPWLCLDFDKPAPHGCPDYANEPEKALSWLLDNDWSWLKGVGFHWQLGNSAGIVPSSEKMSWHLWVWLDKPIAWCSQWLAEKGFDSSMTNPVQLHYTASPVGVSLNKRSGLIKGDVLRGVVENAEPTPSGLKYQDGYECSEEEQLHLSAELASLDWSKNGRHDTIRAWMLRASMVCLPDSDGMAVEKLIEWGRDRSVAESEVARMQAWATTGLGDGSLDVDPSLRPDLVFDDEEDRILRGEDVEAQADDIGCGSLVKSLCSAEDRFDWLKENLPRLKNLDPIEQGRVRDAWGAGVRVFDRALKEQNNGEGEKDWAQVATDFLSERKTPLIYVDSEWYSWNGRFYELFEDIWVKKEVSGVIDEPTTSKVGNAFQQVQFSALRKYEGEPNGVPFKNGRLTKEGKLTPHTPENGGRYCLSFDYNPNAECPTWLKCLGEWFHDEERPLILRQWMNYLITGRTNLQKIMLFVGEQRGGKGTILNVMQSLIGEGNYSTPSMANLASDFGLQSSIGRKAMFISDAHLPQRDRSTILDRLKGVSGKDRIDVNRKNLPPLRGVRLGQIVIACNQMDDIKDESNALIDRYSIIKFTKSFLGKEDRDLGEKIEAELSGIFNWAMSCPEFGAFHEDEKGREAKEDMSLSANPVRGWSKNCCVADEWEQTKTDDLYRSFEKWCEENSVRHIPNKNSFVRSTKNIFPESTIKLVREGLSRHKILIGVKLTVETPEIADEEEDDTF